MAMRVLQISPFPATDTPNTGGAIRIAETAKAYRRAGCIVDPCCIVTKKRHVRNDLDLLLPWFDRFWRPYLGKPKNVGPIRQLWSTLRSDRLLNQLIPKLTHAYDIVHIEHPWTIRLAQGIRQHITTAPPILVYGSHNIESHFYEHLWRQNGSWNAQAASVLNQIVDAETNCALSADLSWAVSESDGNALKALGAKTVVLAPNGCRHLPAPTSLPEIPFRPYVIFVGGAFPPNRDGFKEWVGTALDYIPADASIVVAGTVGDLLSSDAHYQKALKDHRLINFGKTDQALLDQLILHARAVLLPVTQGGGTNLKTAEALCARRPVISTDIGMRGFTEWASDEQVHVCTNPKQFQEKIKSVLESPHQDDCTRDVTSLHWDQCLEEGVKSAIKGIKSRSQHEKKGCKHECA